MSLTKIVSEMLKNGEWLAIYYSFTIYDWLALASLFFLKTVHVTNTYILLSSFSAPHLSILSISFVIHLSSGYASHFLECVWIFFLIFNLSVAILSLQNGLLCFLPLHLAAERVDIPWFATSAIFSAGAATKQTSTNTGNSYRFFLLCLNFMFFTTLCMFFSILITVWLNGVFLSAVVEKKNVFGDKFNFMIY